MITKNKKKNFSNVDYRFSFSLTISDLENNSNDVIICKRDFNIYNLDEDSLSSLELKESVDDIVTLINRDLKSKSRVYTWYNYDENYNDTEFSKPMPESVNSTFKFTMYDRDKPVISKIWTGDGYPLAVRNNVDLTNKKYKYEGNNVEMDFVKQIAKKASADKPDLTTIIMKHLSSTCASYQPKQGGSKLMYKQHIPELGLETVVINKDNTYGSAIKKLGNVKIISDDNGNEKELCEVYTTKCSFGDKEYGLLKKDWYGVV